MVTTTKITPRRIMNTTAHIVHPNPTRGMSLLTMIGKMMPPIDEPEVAIPYAVALFAFHYVARAPSFAYTTALAPIALQIAWDRKTW